MGDNTGVRLKTCGGAKSPGKGLCHESTSPWANIERRQTQRTKTERHRKVNQFLCFCLIFSTCLTQLPFKFSYFDTSTESIPVKKLLTFSLPTHEWAIQNRGMKQAVPSSFSLDIKLTRNRPGRRQPND